MLAVFDKSVAKSPDALAQHPENESLPALKDGFLATYFSSVHPGSVVINLASAGFMAYSSDRQNPVLPRLFAVMDDIFCLFEGHIQNVAHLKQQYGLNKTANEDADGNVPFFWGTDADGHLVLSTDGEVVKQGCGKSFAPFPKGCFYTSSGGLRSYEHPVNELKAVPRIDSSGEVCGLTFKVDADTRKGTTGMPRVGSDANWSQNY